MVSHSRHACIFLTKPNQCASFKIFLYYLMGATESQDPGTVNPKHIVKIK